MTVLGAILAGGRSTRFGSDKALARWQGRPLLDHVIASLSPQCDSTIIVGRVYNDLPSVADSPTSDMGPLAGLAGALEYARDGGFSSVLSVGVDSLHLPPDLRDRLTPAPAFVANQPVIGLWPVSVLSLLHQILASEERHSMLHFIELLGARPVTLEKPPFNINTQADLDALKSKLG
jgi:molybdenum cofactor guanylyltransferase